MLLIISPSKTQKMDGAVLSRFTRPALLDKSRILARLLAGYDREELASLMKMSPRLAELTYERYQSFSLPFTPDNARQAMLVFRGDQFSSLPVDEYTEEDFLFSQNCLRILSGLYGVLRPLDLMQPYRLEMAAGLKVGEAKNLYAFWRKSVTAELASALAGMDSPVLVNLASDEYSRVVQVQELGCPVVKISFKEVKGDRARVVAIHAKRARGMMVDFVIRGRIEDVEQLKAFTTGGYGFTASLSTDAEWVFCRTQP